MAILQGLIRYSLLTKRSIIFPTATPIKSSITKKNEKFGSFVLTMIFVTIGYHQFIKLTCLLHHWTPSSLWLIGK